MSMLNEVVKQTFSFLVLGFFVLPIAALYVRQVLKEHGHLMQANPYFALLNVSTFWVEAENKNKELNIRNVSLVLRALSIWWYLVLAFFIGMVVLDYVAK